MKRVEKSRIQEPEVRSQNKRKTKSVKAVSALSFWLLNSEFWIPASGFRLLLFLISASNV
jgi:hypothetical protein